MFSDDFMSGIWVYVFVWVSVNVFVRRGQWCSVAVVVCFVVLQVGATTKMTNFELHLTLRCAVELSTNTSILPVSLMGVHPLKQLK